MYLLIIDVLTIMVFMAVLLLMLLLVVDVRVSSLSLVCGPSLGHYLSLTVD